MKLLLTNDDGIDADGLHALLAAARRLGDPVLVAPAEPQSGCSHTTSSSIRVEPRDDGRFAVHGTRKKGFDFDWPRAARWAGRVLADLLARPVEPGMFWSVNLPHLMPGDSDPDIVECPLDPHPLPLSYRHEEGTHYYDGDYHGRKRLPGGDVDVCFGGRIAVTRVRLL